MAVSRSVQFKGIPAVLKAYENADIAPWAIYCNTQLIIKYEATDIEGGKTYLKQTLAQLAPQGDLATYTLALYEELKKGEKISSKTPYGMSFNFKLDEDDRGSARGRNSEYEARIAGLEAEILKLRSEDEEQEAIGATGPWGMVMKLLDHPEIHGAIAGKVVDFIGSIGGLNRPLANITRNPDYDPPQPAKVAGLNDDHNTVQLEKIRKAIDSLAKADPYLGDHLEAIAKIASTDPAQYKLLVGMLSK